jgi:hypothetical protein
VFCLASRCGGTVVVGGRREAAQDLDVRPAGPLARLFRPPEVADLL